MRTYPASSHIQPQSTSRILMVRPASFGFNVQTSDSNAFQHNPSVSSKDEIKNLALQEFDAMVTFLKAAGIEVYVFEDTPIPSKPDAVFPNNWISFHQSGKIVIYPMLTPNRQAERRMEILEELKKRFHIEEIIDLSFYERENKFLEGTGSMVLDRFHKIAYACLSPRTHPEVLLAFGKALNYEIISFHATDQNDVPIYHTNVVMCVGDAFAVVCLEAVRSQDERHLLRSALENTGKYVVEISSIQLQQFAGNMLLVENTNHQKTLVMSAKAHQSLSYSQLDALDDYARILPVDLDTIETYGGGSARCMMAEIHLPLK